MRELIRQFVKIVAETLPIPEPVYEFGSLQVSGQEGFADLRPFFKGKDYVGCDMREGPGVDRILNLHNIDLPSNSIGTVLILETLEHVEFPRKALEEVHRILKPNGICVVSSVMNFPIHDYPCDYWRFTPEGFGSLMDIFASKFVFSAGNKNFPHTVIGIGFKNSVSQDHISEFTKMMAEWEQLWERQEIKLPRLLRTSAKLLLPPIFLNVYRKVRRI